MKAPQSGTFVSTVKENIQMSMTKNNDGAVGRSSIKRELTMEVDTVIILMTTVRKQGVVFLFFLFRVVHISPSPGDITSAID